MPWFIVAIVLKMVLAWVESQLKSSENIYSAMLDTVPHFEDYGFSRRLGVCEGHAAALGQVRDKIKGALEQKRW
jgi:hypothetical protein